jgi:putative acyl-CoA dehydrogenase
MAQFYRDIEIGTVWEGSGNVAALDVLRAMVREPDGISVYLAECDLAAGANAMLDAQLATLRQQLGSIEAETVEWRARRLVEDLAVALQASLLVRYAPPAVGDAFCAARLGDTGRAFGTVPAGADVGAIVDRALV